LTLDLTDTIIPKSDQLNSNDLLTGPRTFTIKEVTSGNSEQPVNIHLVELPGRPYRPSKGMRRVLVAVWGKESSAYAGRRLTLYRDASVKFGADEVGGIKISHLSHLDQPVRISLTVTRGKFAKHIVEPLSDSTPSTVTVSAETLAELSALFVRKGIAEDARLAGVNRVVGGSATDLECITEDEARLVMAELSKRPDVAGDDLDPTVEPGFGGA